jgi:membrane-associated phospholipid phosphatase
LRSRSFYSQLWGLLARLLSLFFHPFIAASVTLWYSTYATTHDEQAAWRWTILAMALVLIPAILFIAYKLRRHDYTDADISVRQHRFGFYLFLGVCELLCLALLIYLSAPRILTTCFAASLLALTAISLINTRTKVSVHAATSSGCAAIFFLLSPHLGLLGGLASLGVGWSRVYLRQHTFGQVILGWTIAVASVLIIFVFAVHL